MGTMVNTSVFGKLQFGPTSCYNLSHLGIAVRNAAGQMVSYDKSKNEIVNVDLIDFNVKNGIFAIPAAIKDIAVGDTVLHNDKPVFVTSLEGGIQVVDPCAGEKKTILPTKSMFGFDFVTKLVCLIDFGVMNASEENPFGNMMPLLLLGNRDSYGQNDNMSTLLMLSMMGGGKMNFDMSNPLMLLALMGNGGSDDILPFLLMMNGTNPFQELASTKTVTAEKE